MTSFDFEYHKPDTLEEAIDCYQTLSAAKKRVLYYGGGTEIISMARAESIQFEAVIDLKAIPDCGILDREGKDLVIGSGVTLTRIAESQCFPLLCQTVARIADHTIQGKITLGGNLGGTILYKEAALPLMITNSRAKVMTASGLVELPFSQVFDGRLQLAPGVFLVQILIGKDDIALPFNHVKKTKVDKIDYPLVSLAANLKEGKLRAAVSGVARTPILLPFALLNDSTLSTGERTSRISAQLESRVMDDLHGSKGYRLFVLQNILSQLYDNFKGVSQ